MVFNPPQTLFKPRQDPDDRRLGDFILSSPSALPSGTCEIFGWPDEEGIQLNGGRLGAAQAPDHIRRFFYRMTPDARTSQSFSLYDQGNLSLQVGSQAERHQQARSAVAAALHRGSRVLTLGGGHDYGFPDGAAFLQTFAVASNRPLVLNFDAHLDVRPADQNFNSGTPFRRLLNEFKSRFDFVEIGLQPHCNSRTHRDWALQNGADLWWASEIPTADSLVQRLSKYLEPRQGQPLFVSLDIDVLTSRSAPGCSQAWDSGLTSDAVFAALDVCQKLTQWQQLGIYEVSPPLDSDDRTSKLAAQFAYQFALNSARP